MGDVVRRLAIIGAAAIALSAMLQMPPIHYVWNVSASVATGLYRLHPRGDLMVGELVAVDAPQPLAAFLASGGYLPSGVPLLKHVAALPGQTVCRCGLTILIDTIEVGKAQERDGQGRLLPVWHGCRTLADGEAFLMNTQSAISLDGRYFGVLPVSAIIGRAEPLWTGGEQ
nr:MULTISPECIES: S26 family signal peptidase [unclassified Bradyrhizobium]